MKQTITVLSLLMATIGMAQEQLNDYKYIIVPKQFEEFKRDNQYETSTLVKFLFSEKGFEVFYEDEFPEELKNNGCLGLRAKLIDGSSMFTTKAAVKLENCNGEVVFTTKEGKSKEKDYKDSYGEALRDAFTSFDTIDYAYNGKAEKSGPVTVSMKNDVKKLAEERRQNNTTVNRPTILVEQEATRENQRYVDRRPVPSDLKKAEPNNDTTKKENTQGPQSYQDSDSTTPGTKEASGTDLSDIVSGTLYAQELPNGYQLVDSTPKIRMKIKNTTMPDFYLAEAGSTRGVVFQKNGTWFFEYYSGEELMTKELDIKF